MTDPVLTPASLEVNYRFKSKPEKVFRAWTDPEWLRQWFRVDPAYSTPIAEVDLRVGGRYRLGMQPPDGELQVVGGEYQVVEIPKRLAFTWQWEGAPADAQPMLVTVDFQTMGDGTEVRLRHEKLPSIESRDIHLDGWQGCVAQLYRLID